MRFEITYVHRKPKRVVDEKHFEGSKAFAPVLKLEVGQTAPPRYRSAGYAQIKRVA